MKLVSPSTLEELVELKAAHGDEAVLVAGATDLGVRLRRGMERPAVMLATGRIQQADVLHSTGPREDPAARPGPNERVGEVTFGVRATHRVVEQRAVEDPRLRGLGEACRTVGSLQTRNVGTLVGNVANASPAADGVTALLSLQARVRLLGPDGSRVVDLRDFATGPGQTVLAPQEIISGIQLPPSTGRTGAAFHKLGRRQAMEISIVAAAAQVSLDLDGTLLSATVALGAVAPTVIDVPEATTLLRGLTLAEANSAEALHALGEAAARAVRPRSDHRAGAAYRHRMAGVLTRRVVTTAWKRAIEQGDTDE